MKYILDSHLLIWALFNDEKLPTFAYEAINNPANEIFSTCTVDFLRLCKNLIYFLL